MNAIKNKSRMRGQGGFTLIELLIVIAILGILAGVVVYAVGGTTDSAKKNACKTEKATIETAAEAFKADSVTSAYPATLAALTPKYLKSDPSANFDIQTADPLVVKPIGSAAATGASGGSYKGFYADCSKP